MTQHNFVSFALALALFCAIQTAKAQTFTVLHSFNGADGTAPAYGALIMDGSGNLYGTTYLGGVVGGCYGNGCGVAFKLDPSGKETVLHTFSGDSGDGYPANAREVKSLGR